ncbi:hypothetical protein SUDANB54_06904 [Streptomyces sp. enrichment culture]
MTRVPDAGTGEGISGAGVDGDICNRRPGGPHVPSQCPADADRPTTSGPACRGRRPAAAPGSGTLPGQPHDRGPLNGPLPAAGHRGHARPFQPSAPPSRAAPRPPWSHGSYTCGASTAPDLRGRRPVPVSHPPPPTASCAATACLRLPCRTGPPATPSTSTLRTRPARRAGPHRRQKARPHPRRRRPQGPRPPGGSRQPEAVHGRLRLPSFPTRATAWFADQGISPHWTRPWRPQTNGKANVPTAPARGTGPPAALHLKDRTAGSGS